MKTYIILLFIFLCQYTSAQSTNELEIAPELTFTYWFDQNINKEVLKNKPVILEFWASWCAPCLEILPHINSLSEKYSDDITFLSVNSYDTKEKITELLQHHTFSSFVVMDEDKKLRIL